MKTLVHKFVEFVPDDIEEGILYISMEYKTATHNCICGCGSRVVTPLTPKDWKLTYDGKSISLYPSIGNWNFPCKSHYWIKKNKIEHSYSWLEKESNDRKEPLKKQKKKTRNWFKKKKNKPDES